MHPELQRKLGKRAELQSSYITDTNITYVRHNVIDRDNSVDDLLLANMTGWRNRMKWKEFMLASLQCTISAVKCLFLPIRSFTEPWRHLHRIIYAASTRGKDLWTLCPHAEMVLVRYGFRMSGNFHAFLNVLRYLRRVSRSSLPMSQKMRRLKSGKDAV